MEIKGVHTNSTLTTLKSQEVKKAEVENEATEAKNNAVNKNKVEAKDDAESKNNLLEDPKALRKILDDAADTLNDMVRIFKRQIDFSVHDDTKRLAIKVVDTETHEVIREIPPEELLDLVAKMKETLSLFVDVRV